MAKPYDFLVIGSGCAGLEFALDAAQHGTVAIITKKNKAESNTNYAQGGIASVISSDDSFDQHIEDTLIAGAGLCNPDAVDLIVREGPGIIRELIGRGAEFTSNNGMLDLAREGGHGRNRIIHARDATGREIEMTLLRAVEDNNNITMLEHHFAIEVITEHHLGRDVTRHTENKHCFGAYVLDTNTGRVETILARATLLATGGAGRVYLHTTNPEIATGDGIAMAYRAKARVANMEFIQFHPTTLYTPDSDSFLISEAVRGHGGILKNNDGEAFMSSYDDRAELAPRDIVARAIDDQLKKRGDECVFLDVTHLHEKDLKTNFPTIYSTCLEYGIDITRDQIPVVPAAHYICGGVWTDLDGATTIHGLFAAGEVACTGVHGANRLASNSLLEALVFAKRAAASAAVYIKTAELPDTIPDWDDSGTSETEEWILISHNKKELQQVMWDYVGIVRSDLRLERAFRRTRLLYEEVEGYYKRNAVSVPLCQLRNLIAVSYIIIRSAMMRKESRGLHYSTDYPATSTQARNDTVIG
ncbi:MAG: L-aspartate oxidase [Balneolaceae bacterium]|nr:MAG: L-aspartate oxidase [Balneolaceae bacterium]